MLYGTCVCVCVCVCARARARARVPVYNPSIAACTRARIRLTLRYAINSRHNVNNLYVNHRAAIARDQPRVRRRNHAWLAASFRIYAYGLDTSDETDLPGESFRPHEDFRRFNRIKLYADRSESQRRAIRNVLKQASVHHDDRIYRGESERDTECGIELREGKPRANSRSRVRSRASTWPHRSCIYTTYHTARARARAQHHLSGETKGSDPRHRFIGDS